jgi:hypothetical protein
MLAVVISSHAEEQINIFALAIQRGITSEDLNFEGFSLGSLWAFFSEITVKMHRCS